MRKLEAQVAYLKKSIALKAQRRSQTGTKPSWSRRSGETHATIHSRLRSRCGGPEVAQATTEQIEARIALLREWFVGRH